MSTKRETAVQEIDEFYQTLEELYQKRYPGLKLDPAIFDMLWPFAEQAHGIIEVHWSSVEKLACELLKTRSLGREEIEALLPWAGQFVVEYIG
jgi:hypothetical protein